MITGTLKEIPLGGLASTPSDYDCQDGEMMVCHNMVGGKGVAEATVVKVGEDEDAQELPEMGAGAELVFVHNTSFGKVYICVMNKGPHYFKDGEWVRLDDGTFQDDFIVGKDNITHVGNILVLNIHDGLNYFVYKGHDNGYKYLGTKLPDLDASFTLREATYLEGKIGSSEDLYTDLNNGMKMFVRKGLVNSSREEFTKQQNWDEGKYDDPLFGAYNYVQAECRKKSLFTKPFLVRYALKMYDGNYIMHSSPVLMVPSYCIPMHVLAVHGSAEENRNIHISAYPAETLNIDKASMYSIAFFNQAKLCWKINSHSQLGKWKDIIQEVCVFVTPEISSYSSTGKITAQRICTESTWSGDYSDFSYRHDGKIEQNIRVYRNESQDHRPAAAFIEMPNREGSIGTWIEEASQNFRLLKSFTVDEILAKSSQYDFERIIGTGNTGTENINVSEQLIDGYRVRTEIKPSFMHTYNNRLNLANLVLKERDTFPTGFVSSYATGTDEIKAEVYIEEDGVWNKTETESTSWAAPNILPGFFYYPNPNAKYLHLGDKWMKLKPHPFLNGAYYLNENLTGFVGIETPPEITVTEEGVPRPNYIYTSEVDNPFIFPALGVNQIGSGKIKAIKSATKAMSEGTAFGAQPLYVFTEDGIFALSVNSVGLYDKAAPLSRETVSDASKVLSIDNSVIFLNARGLMELNGSRTRCLSEKLTDRYCTVDLWGLTNWGLVDRMRPEADASGTGAAYGIACGFMDYIKGNARLAFDYVNYRIYVFSDEKYAYVYDIGTKLWSTCASSMHSSVEGFPATFINIKQFDENGSWIGTKVCQFSSDDSELVDDGQVLWLTRPLKFGEHDVLKTVRRVIARGRFSDKDNLTLALWGSRNMMDWVYVGGVKKGVNLPRLSGSPYKYFIVGGSAKMSNEDMLSRLTIEKSERYLNKPR